MNNPTKIIIPIHCRNTDLLPLSLMVFSTIRTGFPDGDILVLDIANSTYVHSEICAAADKAYAKVKPVGERLLHHEVMQAFTEGAMKDKSAEPFWFCDPDVVFWESMQEVQAGFGDTALAGRWIPAFRDPFTKCWTFGRFHPSLLYVNPVRLKAELEEYRSQFPATEYNPMANLYAPLHIPGWCSCDEEFYDTIGLLSKISSGIPFMGELDRYDHLMMGSCVDVIAEHIGDKELVQRHLAYAKEPRRGLWKQQQKWFEERSQ